MSRINRDWLSGQTATPEPSADEAVTSPRERTSGAVYLEPHRPASGWGLMAQVAAVAAANCATSQVYSLETYVQRGLDNEWISSWHA